MTPALNRSMLTKNYIIIFCINGFNMLSFRRIFPSLLLIFLATLIFKAQVALANFSRLQQNVDGFWVTLKGNALLIAAGVFVLGLISKYCVRFTADFDYKVDFELLSWLCYCLSFGAVCYYFV